MGWNWGAGVGPGLPRLRESSLRGCAGRGRGVEVCAAAPLTLVMFGWLSEVQGAFPWWCLIREQLVIVFVRG